MRKAVFALIAVASILLLGARPSGPPPQLITGDAPALEVVSPGEKRETRQTLGPLELYFSAGVDKSAEQARILVSIARDGKVIARQRSTIWLEREKAPFGR